MSPAGAPPSPPTPAAPAATASSPSATASSPIAPPPDAPAGRSSARRALPALPLVVLLAMLIALVVLRTQHTAGTGAAAATSGASDTRSTDAAVIAAATAVDPDVLDRIGTGGVVRVPTAINGPTVSAGGVPRIVWSGAEYCPTCAAMRWPLVIALARFGRFDGLAVTASSGREAYPNTPTFTFRDASYRSDVLAFTAYETASSTWADGRYEPLATVPAADRQLLSAYAGPPYFAATDPDDPDASPFVLYAGQYASAGPLFTPAVLDGLDAAQIARALADPDSAAGRAIDGAANVLTAVLCTATGDTPREVCDSPAVAAARQLVSPRSAG